MQVVHVKEPLAVGNCVKSKLKSCYLGKIMSYQYCLLSPSFSFLFLQHHEGHLVESISRTLCITLLKRPSAIANPDRDKMKEDTRDLSVEGNKKQFEYIWNVICMKAFYGFNQMRQYYVQIFCYKTNYIQLYCLIKLYVLQNAINATPRDAEIYWSKGIFSSEHIQWAREWWEK